MLGTLLALSLCSSLPQGDAPAATVRALMHGPRGTADALASRGYDAHALLGPRRGGETIEVFASPAELAALRDAYPGLPLIELERGRPLRDILAAARPPEAPPDPQYRTDVEIAQDLLALEQNHPSLAQRVDLTTRYQGPPTHGGRHIYALKISDNVTASEDEPSMLFVGNHHARELNTIELPFEVANRLLASYGTDPVLTSVVDDNEVWIVPTMNPDGLHHVWNFDNWWRKNRRNNGDGTYGVDLNRNYPYFWSRCGSSSLTSSNTYHGPSAASEPETQVMLAFGRAERFERVWDEHSYGRDVRWAHNPLTVNRIPAAVANVLDPLQARIANAMSYAVNSSCCCGGHQHWHFAEYGALAYLMEMGGSFQPPYSSTVGELTRMWPGVLEFLSEPVPLTGHVTSVDGGTPVEARIRLPAAPFLDGQERWSNPRFGRYSVWLDAGTYTLEFSAQGFETRNVTVTLQSGQTVVEDVQMVPVLPPTTLTATGTPRPGATVALDVTSPADAGLPYLIAVSDATSPPIGIGPRTVPLADSPLIVGASQVPQYFANFTGNLDGSGTAQGQLHIPNIPALTGLGLHFAAVTFDPAWLLGIKGISNRVTLTVQ